MLFSIGLLIVIVFLAFKAAPVEKKNHALIHGAGQVGFLVNGETTLAVPYYRVGGFLPIMAMGLAIRQHNLKTMQGRKRFWGCFGATVTATLAGLVFVGQIVGKWGEGGWVVLVSLSILVLMGHAILISPIGSRTPQDIHRIVRYKSRNKIHRSRGLINRLLLNYL